MESTYVSVNGQTDKKDLAYKTMYTMYKMSHLSGFLKSQIHRSESKMEVPRGQRKEWVIKEKLGKEQKISPGRKKSVKIYFTTW